MNTFYHRSVMSKEITSFFQGCTGKTLVDVTAGGGGHLALLATLVGPQGRVIALDRDLRAHEEDAALGVARDFPEIIQLFHRPFSMLRQTLDQCAIQEIDGIIADLGVSSHQLDQASRGFSFMADGPIDMRMDQSAKISAYEWLRIASEKEIADAIYRFGQERKSRAIASLIKKSWPIENSTLALAKLVLSAIKQRTWSKIHPATRTFQALRMVVNDEYAELHNLLEELPTLLATDGTAVFLSFHSLEDGLVKRKFREMASKKVLEGSPQFALLTKKPLIANEEEITQNRRSRSAKLRAIKRIS